ncbi:MAG: hypothetical protein JXM71_07330 [Spirochaetales bacterium]|nr:hypothetical protein [Spirochaetales bacterium]
MIGLLVAVLLFIPSRSGIVQADPAISAADTISRGVPSETGRLAFMLQAVEYVRFLIARSRGFADTGALAAVALVYGIAHTLGPGHQKSLMVGTLLSTRASPGLVVRAARHHHSESRRPDYRASCFLAPRRESSRPPS